MLEETLQSGTNFEQFDTTIIPTAQSSQFKNAVL